MIYIIWHNWEESDGIYFVADTLPFLLRSSFLFEEGVTPLMLQLLGYAICELKSQAVSSPQKNKKDKDKDKSKSKDKDTEKEKEKHKDKEKTSGIVLLFEVFPNTQHHMEVLVDNFQ